VRTIEERFWSKVAAGAPDECWEWQRSRKDDGYGQFKVTAGQSPQRASRVAWMLTHGSIPDGLFVLHRCDNPPCCNPAHLFLGTSADNHADMTAKGRASGYQHHSYLKLVQGVRRLSDDEIRLARHLHGQGASCRSVARRLGVSHTTISRLINGTHWRRHAA
jgi:uncharacterized protein YerC